MKTRSIRRFLYEVLAQDIKDLGIDAVFGLASDDTAAMISALEQANVRFYQTRHENTAVAMAEGYASATGKLGLAIIGCGPATANSINGVMYAIKTYSPVLVIYGDDVAHVPPGNHLGPNYKSLDAERLLSSLGAPVYKASSKDTVRSILVDAATEAMQGKLVAMLLPKDLPYYEVEVTPLLRPSQKEVELAPRPQSIVEAITLLNNSKKPVILAGQGALHAKEQLIKLAEKTGALLGTTLKARDMFAGHPHNVSIIGGFSHSVAKELVATSDCVVVFGASLNFFTIANGKSFPNASIIHVDKERSHIGQWCPVDVSVVGDAKRVAEAILEQVEGKVTNPDILRKLAEIKGVEDFEDVSTDMLMDPRAVAAELTQILPEDYNTVWDGGNFMLALPYLSVSSPKRFKFTVDSFSIGMGLGPAMAYAIANPDLLTVFIVGDGGLLMNIGELETIVREKLPIVVIVMNDSAFGAEVNFLRNLHLPTDTVSFPPVNFAAVAQGFGFESYTVQTREELRALASVINNPKGPVLIDCKTTNSVAYYRHIVDEDQKGKMPLAFAGAPPLAL